MGVVVDLLSSGRTPPPPPPQGRIGVLVNREGKGSKLARFRERVMKSGSPILRELQQLSMQIDVPKTIKKTSVELLDAFVDSVFEFVDQPLLPSQLRFGKINKYISNTNIFKHSGKLYSIAESDLPQEINILTLETLGNWDVNGAWDRPFTSHPKSCYYSADGNKLIHKVDLKFHRCSLPHDIGVTQRLIKYDNKEYARIGVMPRYGDAESIRWFAVEPCSAFHIINCFEDGDEEELQVIVWACRARESIIPGPDHGLNKFEWFSKGFKHINLIDQNCEDSLTQEEGFFFSRAYEWRLNMKNGEVKEKNLTGKKFSMDFPMINEHFTGVKNKYGYTQVVDSLASSTSGMAKYGGIAKLYFEEPEVGYCLDGQKKPEELIKVEYNMFPENTFCSGSTFVSKSGGLEEDDGWIISYVHNEDSNISEVYIIDAKKFTSEAVAKITLTCRVPYGFHGAFISK
ncbi:hypothetical protein LguiB_012023 [Lonicera macranthoides]